MQDIEQLRKLLHYFWFDGGSMQSGTYVGRGYFFVSLGQHTAA